MGEKQKKRKPISPVAVNMVALRKERGWTQTQMADFLETDLSKIARTEVGILKPSVEMLIQMVEKFGISADDLIRSHPMTENERKMQTLISGVKALDDHNLSNIRKYVDTCNRPENENCKVIMKLVIAPNIID